MAIIHVLGSGGWFPSARRHTCTYLVEMQDKLICIDTGSGTSRLRDYVWLLNQYDTIYIIYTHYHHDHVAGLGYLPRFISDKQVHIYGPGAPYYPKGCHAILATYTSSPYFPGPIDQIVKHITFTDYDEKGFEIEDILIQVLPQIHADPTFGLQFGKTFYFATDTEPLQNTFERAAQTALLIHECWGVSGEFSGHTSAEAIQTHLVQYPVADTFLIHAHPDWTPEMEQRLLTTFEPTQQVNMMQDYQQIIVNPKP